MDDNDPSKLICYNLQYGNATDGSNITSGNDDAGGAIFVYNFSDLLISGPWAGRAGETATSRAGEVYTMVLPGDADGDGSVTEKSEQTM